MTKTTDKPAFTIIGSGAPTTMQPPRTLGRYGLALWNAIHGGYEISDAGGIELLLQACEMQDRVQAIAAQIAADGPTIRTKSGVRSHPLLKDEVAGRAFVTRTLSKLGVVYAEVQAPGRPPTNIHWGGS